MARKIISLPVISNVFNGLNHFLLEIRWLVRRDQEAGHKDSYLFDCWVMNLTYNNSFGVLACFISYEILDE